MQTAFWEFVPESCRKIVRTLQVAGKPLTEAEMAAAIGIKELGHKSMRLLISRGIVMVTRIYDRKDARLQYELSPKARKELLAPELE